MPHPGFPEEKLDTLRKGVLWSAPSAYELRATWSDLTCQPRQQARLACFYELPEIWLCARSKQLATRIVS